MHYRKTVKRCNLELNPKKKSENKSLFREFRIRPPYKSIKDIFCLRVDRMVNSYRKISINKLELKVPSAPLHDLSACGNAQARENPTSDSTR